MTTKTEPKGAGHGAGWSGAKGQAICDLLVKHPDWTRRQIAESVACTVARVGECVRKLAFDGITAEEALRRVPAGEKSGGINSAGTNNRKITDAEPKARTRRIRATTEEPKAEAPKARAPRGRKTHEEYVEMVATLLNPNGRTPEELATCKEKAQQITDREGITRSEVEAWVMAHTVNAVRNVRRRPRTAA